MKNSGIGGWFGVALVAAAAVAGPESRAAARWSTERARSWQEKTGWLVGCNFSPSTAINQLEMWQAETFDSATIARELGWAESIGLNSIRVFLHDIPWRQDSKGFLERIDRFLSIADKHRIRVMFVLLDDCWDPFPKPGKQRDPKPHVHNSGWVQCPGSEILSAPSRHDELAGYVKGIIGRFKNDPRVAVWDLYNEPGNGNASAYGAQELKDKASFSMMLLKKVFEWAKEVDPSQPLTAGPWEGDWSAPEKMSPLNRFMTEESDIVTFHRYAGRDIVEQNIRDLRRYNRPILCTEYMSRPSGSTFEAILPLLKEQNVGAFNWGCVDGKTQTIYPWDSWKKTYTAEPPVWFHDIFRRDGAPYRPEEADLIRRLTGRTARP